MLKKIKLTAVVSAALCLFSMTAAAKEFTVLYVPLDNRPVCASYPAQVMQASGCKIIMPPEKFIANNDINGNPEEILEWLEHKAPKADAAVISTDSLIYGGLVASRTHSIPREVLQSRIARLNDLQKALPIKLYVFSTIMRTPRASFGRVEPDYYSTVGPAIFRYSQLADKSDTTKLPLDEQLTKQALERNMRLDDLGDWLQRRQKNLSVNLELVKMAGTGKFHYFAIGKDDNAPLSATHMEARRISLKTFNYTDDVFQILPGVDQLGLLLLTRAYNEAHGQLPKIMPVYSEGAGGNTLPQYSDTRLFESVPQQITAAGAQVTDDADKADLILALNTPDNGIMQDSTADSNQFFASPANKRFISRINDYLDSGYRVSLADINYSNGADNGFMHAFSQSGRLPLLSAYNGWNTADNTIGFAIAQGILAAHIPYAQNCDLMRQRLIDDWYYQSNARRSISDAFEKHNREDLKYQLGPAEKPVLTQVTAECRSLAKSYPFTAKSKFELSFPWQRLFEIDVHLKNK